MSALRARSSAEAGASTWGRSTSPCGDVAIPAAAAVKSPSPGASSRINWLTAERTARLDPSRAESRTPTSRYRDSTISPSRTRYPRLFVEPTSNSIRVPVIAASTLAASRATNCAARAERAVISSGFETSGLPTPIAHAPAAANSRARSSVTPPVGTSFNPGSGASTARTKSGPSESAGNSFTARAPNRTALIISVGVNAPGTGSIERSSDALMTASSTTGDTTNAAPRR